MAEPHVVVVVLNWNGRQDTLDCLASLRALDGPSPTILVVDNGSSDGSEEAIRSAHPDLPFLQTGSNLGFAGGNNAGIEWARDHDADFVLLLNNDTQVQPDFLARLLARADADPGLGILGCSIAYADAPDRLWAFGGGRFDIATGWVRHIQRPVPDAELATRGTVHFYVTGCAMLIRRGVVEAIGGLDRSYFHFCEDVDYCLRAKQHGFGIGVAPDSHLIHKVSATTQVDSPLFLYYNLRSRLRLVERHGPEGTPRRVAIGVLWLRLWRKAWLAGMGRTGWRALRRGLRDFRTGVTGPAPADLVE